MTTFPAPVSSQLDKIISQHFDETASTVTPDARKAALLTLVFGQVISDAELVRICGAPTGSTLTMHFENACQSGEKVPQGLHVDIVNSKYLKHPMTLVFYEHQPSVMGVYIKLVVGRKVQGLPSVGALILEAMTRAWATTNLKHKTMRHFDMLAAGGRTWHNMNKAGDRWDGFAVWARCGFDMQLETETLDMFKHFPFVPPLAGVVKTCTSLSTLLSLPNGMDFWDLVGKGWYMRFHLNPGSYSRQTLSKYLLRKYP